MRIRYFDWLEVLSIFLVCSLHQTWLRATIPASVATMLVAMAPPLFFMVHGALLLNKEASPKKQITRFLRVLLQVFAWNTIYLLYSIALGAVNPSDIDLPYLFNYYIRFANSAGINSGHLWYIYALLAVYAFYPILKACQAHNENLLKYIWGLCFFAAFFRLEFWLWGGHAGQHFLGQALDVEDFVRNFSPLGEYAHCILYFITGYYLARWAKEQPLNRWVLMGLCLLIFLAGLTLNLLERYVEYGTLVYNWKPITAMYKRVGSLVMAMSIFVLFSQINFRDGWLYRIAKTISMHTLDIYYIHVIYAWTFYRLFYRHDLASVTNNYLRAALVLVLAFFTGQILRRIPLVKKLLT